MGLLAWSKHSKKSTNIPSQCGSVSSILNTDPEIMLDVKNDIKEGAVDLQTAVVVDET
jgi:hypothetical protein